MPNRILKESIHTSPNLNALSPLAERHFYRLLPVPDDFGCFEATSLVVKGRCYPLRPEIKTSEIEKWHSEMVEQQIIRLWTEDGRQFGQFLNWDKHQRVRSLHQRKTPIPPPIDVTCRQMTANDGLNPNPNPNLNLNPKKNKDTLDTTELKEREEKEEEKGSHTLLKEEEKEERGISSSLVLSSSLKAKKPLQPGILGSKMNDTEWFSFLRNLPAYKHIDLDFQLSKMDAWLSANPGRQKTRLFIVKWLNKIERPIKGQGKGSW